MIVGLFYVHGGAGGVPRAPGAAFPELGRVTACFRHQHPTRGRCIRILHPRVPGYKMRVMNHRRPHPRHHPATGRERSSHWRYPVIEDGKSGRGRHSQRRALPAVHIETYHGSYEIEGTKLRYIEHPRESDY